MIVQNEKTKKWILYTHDGSRVLGTHNSYDQALRQERAIQWSKHHRKNPLLNTDKEGYLINAQFSTWDNIYNKENFNPEAILWLHTTNFDSLDEWLSEGFSPNSERFYIGAGGNLEFGKNIVFFKYKPTKLFDFEYDLSDHIINLIYKLFKSDTSGYLLEYFLEDYLFIFKNAYNSVTEYFNQELYDKLNKKTSNLETLESEIKEMIKVSLSSGHYTFFENKAVTEVLLDLGYTGYYESENIGYPKASDLNICVLKPDFDNLEIVGFLKSKEHSPYFWDCPVCKETFGEFGVDYRNKTIENIIVSNKIMCPSCSKA